ncbi:MAG: ABC transporter substrate-binding protein, partial [Candidatus Binatia bacterium]
HHAPSLCNIEQTMKIFLLSSAGDAGKAIIIFVTAFAGLGLSHFSLALEKISFAVPVIAVQYAPIYLGVKEGVFAREGLDIDISVLRTDLAMTALNAGNLDYIAHGGAALRGATRGFPIKLIFALDEKSAFWLLTQPGIRKVAMLKGKKIGISFPGDTPHLVLKRFLKRSGLDPDRDVTYVSGQISPIGFQGLNAGVLDGAVMAPPYTVLAQDKGFQGLAFLGKEVPDAPTVNGIVTSDEKIHSQPNQVKQIVRAMLKSVQLYRQNTEVAVNFLASQFNLEFAVAKRVYGDAVAIVIPDGEVKIDRIRDVLNMAKESGQASPNVVEPESLLDLSFLHEAQRSANKTAERKRSAGTTTQ